MMRIGIDGLPLLGRAGVSVCQICLFNGLLEMDAQNEYQVFFRSFRRKIPRSFSWQGNPHVSIKRIGLPDRVLERLWEGAGPVNFADVFLKSVDVYFSTTYFTPATQARPVVSMVYDLTPLKFEPYRLESGDFERRLRQTLARSTYILAISEHTKSDVCQTYSIDPDRVVTVPMAADAMFVPIEDRDKVQGVVSRYGLRVGQYILYVGNFGPHKNVDGLIEAYARLKRGPKIPHTLVLCGKMHGAGYIVERIKEHGVEDSVRVLDYIEQYDLPFLYNGAGVFVFVSYYEGFGIPPLEAMACGIPVVVSQTTSLPEVTGDAALLVDPKNIDQIARSILTVLDDDALGASMRVAGLRQAQKFSWERSARIALDTFEKARHAPDRIRI
jgi:glycosyltransferase involved in cell wall biosynthesis